MKDNASESTPMAATVGSADDPAPHQDLTGQTLGDFQILRRLGQGGMGQVYLAEQLSLKRKVALKLLRGELSANHKALERFKAEAMAVARATHANIVQVYDIREEKGLHYMVLEYVEGKNLREYLEKKGPPELQVALSIMRQVAAGLQRAHEMGLIHRDIKPENLLLTRKTEVKIADFGLTRFFGDEQKPLHLTETGVAMGTPLYMSPEQIENRPVDPRTDIYSFGVTSYHLLAGTPPFRGQSAYEVALQHVQKEPEPLAGIRPDLPPELCAIIHKMLAKKAEERYQSCRELLRDLVLLRDTMMGLNNSLAMLPTSDSAHTLPQLTQSTQQPAQPRRGVRTWLLLAASVLVMLGLGLGAGWWWQARQQALAVAPGATDTSGATEPLSFGKPPSARKELEAKLWAELKKHDKNSDTKELQEALHAAMDLGVFYVQHGSLDEADKFFLELESSRHYRGPDGTAAQRHFRSTGQAGRGIVLALRDQPRESNDLLLKALDAKGNKLLALERKDRWMQYRGFRELLLEAVRRNNINAPESTPPALARLLLPQRPVATGKMP